MQATTTESGLPAPMDSRAVRILAKSVYRELRSSGHTRSDIVAFTNEVLELVTSELRETQTDD